MNKSETLGELAKALAKAQGELSNAKKSASNPFFKSKYADLAEVINVVKPVFSKEGLSVTQMPSYDAGIVSVETLLLHSSGEWISSVISAPVSKQDAQGVGSAISYCRRYALSAVASIGSEDDDGNSAVGKVPKAAKPKTITKAQAGTLRELIKASGFNEEAVCKQVRVQKLEDLAADRFQGAHDHLSKAAEDVNA